MYFLSSLPLLPLAALASAPPTPAPFTITDISAQTGRLGDGKVAFKFTDPHTQTSSRCSASWTARGKEPFSWVTCGPDKTFAFHFDKERYQGIDNMWVQFRHEYKENNHEVRFCGELHLENTGPGSTTYPCSFALSGFKICTGARPFSVPNHN